MRSHNQLVSSRHYSSHPASADTEVDTMMAEVDTADITDHTAAKHNQVDCKLPAVEHYKPQPYAQTLSGTCPSDMTAYTSSSL
ncbi:hypothetical protein Tco_1292933 [Tanacetum coccineum]